MDSESTEQKKQKEIQALKKRIFELEALFASREAGSLTKDASFNLDLFKYNPLETIVVDRQCRVVDYNLAKGRSDERLPKSGDIMYRDYAAGHEIDMHAELLRCIERNESVTYPSLKYHDKYLRITISPFPKGAIIVSQNVTEQTLAEMALRKSEERYRNLFDRVPVGMYRASANGKLMDVNHALVQIFGFPDKESLLAINLIDLYAHLDEFRNTLDLLQQKVLIRDLEAQFFRFDGKAIWIRMNARAVMDEQNRVQYYEGVVEDVTERRRAEEALKKSEQEKTLILSSLLELVTYQDLNHRIIWANQLAEETFGVGSGELAGKRCHEVWQNGETPCPQCPLQKIIQTGQPQHAERTAPDGRIWASRGYPVRNETGAVIGIVEVNLDITHQKRMEDEKEIIQAQLLQAHKMEAVGTLAGGVAHDFNNLLTAIQGCLDLAMLKLKENNPAYKDLMEVQNASRRAADLTRQLLLFSRRHLTHMVPIQLNQTIDDLLKMLHRLIGEDIEINTNLSPDLWNIKADRGTMEQIIVNLSVNGRDAMPNGGKLTLKTGNVTLDEFYCKLVHEARPGQFVRLSISDTGEGMSHEVRERIFEPFFSTKGPGKGTGLGLSVVYGIVKQHNGWINVYSEPGNGTEFKVYFPAVFTSAEVRVKPKIDLKDLNGRGERILVVEDEQIVQDFSLRALEKHGYVVRAVSTVEDALKIFAEEHQNFDMVFSDVVLPDTSGLVMIDQLLKEKPNLKIVLTSGYTDTKSQWKAIQEKGYHFLQKPYTLLDLLRAIKRKFTAE